MTSASHARRRAVPGDSSRPSSVTGDPSARPCRASRVRVTATRGRAPCASGTSRVVRACSQVWIIASHIRAPWSRTSSTSPQSSSPVGAGGGGFGERQQGGLDDGGVLDGAAPAQPDAAGAVLGDGEVAAEVGGAVLAVEVSLGLAFGAVGVDDVDQVARGLGEVACVQPPGLREQGLLGLFPQVRVGGELLDGVHDDGGLFGGDQAVPEGVAGGGAVGDEELGVAHGAASGAGVGAGEVGVPVAGGGPGEVLFGDLAVLDLGEGGGLDGGEVGAEGLAGGDGVDDLLGGLGGPEDVVDGSDQPAWAAASDIGGTVGRGRVGLSMGPCKHRPPTIEGRWSRQISVFERFLEEKFETPPDALVAGSRGSGAARPRTSGALRTPMNGRRGVRR